MTHDSLELVFKQGGGVEVRAPTQSEKTDVLMWASDNDPDFMDQFSNELLTPDEDAEDILEYLIDNDVLNEEEADSIEIFSEDEEE